MTRLIKTFLLLAVLVLLSACGSKSAWELAPGIYILDKDKPIESLDDLAGRIPGKAIYVDRWATWCAPCLEEFAYLDVLLEFLESHDIALLFLNSNAGIEEEDWFDFIREHDLRGHHARLSRNMMADLVDKGAFIPLIPQYLIINELGEVVEHNALRPSNEEELFAQLTELLGS